MRTLKYSLLLAFLAFFTGGLSGQEIHTDYDHSANFSGYRTYSWTKVASDNPLWQKRIVEDVDGAMQKAGFQKVESGGDIAVAAVGAARNQREYETFYNGFPGWRWRGLGSTATTRAINYRVGTLVVDLYDTQNKNLVWRGTAADTLSDDPQKNQEKLQKAETRCWLRRSFRIAERSPELDNKRSPVSLSRL